MSSSSFAAVHRAAAARQADPSILESYQKDLCEAHELIQLQESAIFGLEEKLRLANEKIAQMKMEKEKDRQIQKKLHTEISYLQAKQEENSEYFDSKKLDANKLKMVSLEIKNKNLTKKLEVSEKLMKNMKMNEKNYEDLVDKLINQVKQLKDQNRQLEKKCVYEREMAEFEATFLPILMQHDENESLKKELELTRAARQTAEELIEKQKRQLETQLEEIYTLKGCIFTLGEYERNEILKKERSEKNSLKQ